MKRTLLDGWKEVEFQDIASFNSGFAFSSSDYKNNGTKIIRIQNLGNNKDEKFVYWDKQYDKKYLIKEGDLLLSLSGTIPVSFKIHEWKGEDALLNQRILKINLSEHLVDKKYIKYAVFKGLINVYSKAKSTTGIANVGIGTVRSLKIILPPLPTQKKIVSILENLEKVKEWRKEADELTKDFLKSVFLEMFGDLISNPKGGELKKLGKLSSVGSSKRVFVNELVDEGVPFYRGTEVGALSVGENISPKLFITEEHYSKLKEYTGVPTIGDLLLPSICFDGRIWRVDTENPFYFKDGRVLWIHLENSDIDSTYLQYLLSEKFVRDYHQIASGTTFAELKIFALKNIDIQLPPIELQNKFASIAKEVEAMKEQQKNSKNQIDDLFNALMQKAFKGELVA